MKECNFNMESIIKALYENVLDRKGTSVGVSDAALFLYCREAANIFNAAETDLNLNNIVHKIASESYADGHENGFECGFLTAISVLDTLRGAKQ